MASNTGFDITVPSGTSLVSDGDNDLRQVKTFIKEWWEQEHYGTDGSATSAGVHKSGSARIYTQSAAPTAVNIGELWHDPDDDALYVAEAAGTGKWQIVTNTLSLGDTHTWTAKQTFSDVAVTSAVDNILSTAATVDVGNITAGETASFTITVTGATAGSPVIVGYAARPNNVITQAFVSATNTVTVDLINTDSVDQNPASQEYTATVFNKPA